MRSTKDLQTDPDNPRTISAEALAGLKASLSRFGDLSGIVVNATTGQLVCGHQRVRAMTELYGDLPIDSGAIVTPTGERYPVRIVEMTPAEQRAANIVANSPHIAGDYTDGLQLQLDELKLELPDYADLALPALEIATWDGVAEDSDELNARGKGNSRMQRDGMDLVCVGPWCGPADRERILEVCTSIQERFGDASTEGAVFVLDVIASALCR